jgi:cellulose synthase/poly-beta-1,6-N-acetylglucosamine synthase-like glycosyltransferase
MAEQILRVDSALGHSAGPVPADLAEGLASDNAPLVLQHDSLFASLPPPPPVPGPDFNWGLALDSLQGVLADAIPLLQWFFLLNFIALNGGYLLLNLASLFMIRTYLREQDAAAPYLSTAKHEIPISIILPAGNDAAAVVARVHAMLQLDYSEFEIIIVNDGSYEPVLKALVHEFSLAPFPEAYRERLPSKHVKAFLASSVYPGLRLVDKESGGRADALNAALNCARYPLFCIMDNDFVLQRDSLSKMGRAFQNKPTVVAACASVGVANGCTLQGGFMESIGFPRSWLALFQVIEYLRNARFARMFWSRLNAMLITTRIFGVFHKETVIAAGGFRTDTLNEDMELVARIHRLLRRENKRYHIAYVPDALCWADATENWKLLKLQCMNRQISLAQALEMNRQLLLGRRGGAVGWLGFPFIFLFEVMAPWLEVLGYLIMTLLWLSGLISFQAFWTFLLAVIGLGVLHSTSALLMDEMTLRTNRKLSHALKLFAVALLENLGYRQLTAFWRVIGTVRMRGQVRCTNSLSAPDSNTRQITA